MPISRPNSSKRPRTQPHRFPPSAAIDDSEPRCEGLWTPIVRTASIADPVQLFTSNIFDYGDFTAHFGDDIGSRRMFENGKRRRRHCTGADCLGAGALHLPCRRSARRGGSSGSSRSHFVIDLCGRTWWLAEQASKDSPADPHDALWRCALERGLAAVPAKATSAEADGFRQRVSSNTRESRSEAGRWQASCPPTARWMTRSTPLSPRRSRNPA